MSERDEAAAKAMAEAMKIVEMSLMQGGMKLAKPGPRTGMVSVFVNDHAGTPRKLVNAEGKVIWQAEMDDWGAVARQRGVRQLIRFQGQWEDEESGFYYNRFRYYDPKQGRYITQDPIGLAGEVNNTIYPTNPVGEVDPLGLDACYVHFPNYPITYNETGDTSTRLGGHAGVLTYDKKGSTKYYEYGRYSTGIGAKLPEDDGNIRRVYIPNLKINKDGNPTAESMAALKAALSRNAGKNTEATLTCSASSDLSKVHEHIKKIANDPNRDKYSWNPFSPNHCRSFAKDAVEAGRGK